MYPQQPRRRTNVHPGGARGASEGIRGRFQTFTTGLRPGTDASTCGWTCRRWLSVSYEEKETDVSIAVQLVEDGVRGVFDTALLISADSDLCPAVRSLKRLSPTKRIIAVFPPRRHSEDLRKAANGMIKINDVTVRNSQLPRSWPPPPVSR